MAYPSLQEEVILAAKSCRSEAHLQRALQQLRAAEAAEASPAAEAASPLRESHSIFGKMGESLEELGHKVRFFLF